MMPTPEHIQQVQQFTRGVTAEIVERRNHIEVWLSGSDPQSQGAANQLRPILVQGILAVLSAMGVTGKHVIYD